MPLKFDEKMAKKLRPLTIDSSSHLPQDKQYCIMEAVSYIAGLPHSDAPVCVSNTITGFLIGINDTRADTKERNKLKKVIPEIIGTQPTKKTRVKSRFNEVTDEWEKGDFEVEIPKETKGYRVGERRRQRVLVEEVQALGLKASVYEDGTDTELDFDASDIGTKDAIRITKKLAAIKNKA